MNDLITDLFDIFVCPCPTHPFGIIAVILPFPPPNVVPGFTIIPGVSFSISSVATPPLPITPVPLSLSVVQTQGPQTPVRLVWAVMPLDIYRLSPAKSTSCLLSLRYFVYMSYFRENALSLALISPPAGICGICLILSHPPKY